MHFYILIQLKSYGATIKTSEGKKTPAQVTVDRHARLKPYTSDIHKPEGWSSTEPLMQSSYWS